jgi:hypothetical protein
MALGHKEGLGADAGPIDQPDRNLDLSRVRLWQILLKNSSSKHFRYVAENAIPRPS